MKYPHYDTTQYTYYNIHIVEVERNVGVVEEIQ